MTGRSGWADHPAWCSQGRYCESVHRCSDGTTEWAHAAFPFVLRSDGPTDGRADVFLVRMDHVTAAAEHLVTAAIVLTAEGSLSADQAREVGRALLRAADQLDDEVACSGAPSTS